MCVRITHTHNIVEGNSNENLYVTKRIILILLAFSFNFVGSNNTHMHTLLPS